ncbi:MAG: hypothetical protein LBR29_04045 [Methylobacteriaceae bacterium]|nr:hypothetical protein [Methylobacteriaceae bacterium]
MTNSPLYGILLPVCAAAAVLSSAGSADAKQFKNARYDFVVNVPDNFMALPEPANGDGRAFVLMANEDVSLRFYARLKQGEDSIARVCEAEIPDGADNSDMTLNRRDCYIYYDYEGLHTELFVFLVRGAFYFGISTVPVSQQQSYQDVFHKVFVSWKIHGNPTVY